MKRWAPAVLVFGIVAAACRDTTPPPSAQAAAGAAAADTADQSFIGLETNLNEGGVRRAHLKAETARYYDRSHRLELVNVSMEFFTSTGVRESALTAKRATFDRLNNQLQVAGDVTITSADGRKIVTQHMRYDKSTNEITGDSAFVASSPERSREGVGFKADPALTAISSDNWSKAAPPGAVSR